MNYEMRDLINRKSRLEDIIENASKRIIFLQKSLAKVCDHKYEDGSSAVKDGHTLFPYCDICRCDPWL